MCVLMHHTTIEYLVRLSHVTSQLRINFTFPLVPPGAEI